MAETDLDRADEMGAALDRVMRDASAAVLRGYELRTDVQIVRPGDRYYDKRGAEMWATIERLLNQLEAKRSA
jgi:DNA polymerase I